MTMTNPDKPITKQDLADFYGEILPFMGGMPEVLANKFARGDLYDTNEKMIGKWIDGKPLYQKTVECGALPNKGSKQVAHGITNLNRVHACFGMRYETSTGENSPFPFTSDKYLNNQTGIYITDTYIELGNRDVDLSGYTVILTLQYTKTTDQANSFNIGSDTDYSTEEKIVGTWIDGSYIYQKTYYLDSLYIPSGGTSIDITNFLDHEHIEVVGLEGGYYQHIEGGQYKQYHHWGFQNNFGYECHYRQSDKTISIEGNWGNQSTTFDHLSFTFKYIYV